MHGPSSTLCSRVSQRRRRETVQLNLMFLEIPTPSTRVWETLEEEQRRTALELLAKLIAQAAEPETKAEGRNDD